MSRTRILSPVKAQRTLNRLSCEIIERNRGGERVEIVGIRKRGTELAKMLAIGVGEKIGRMLVVNELDVRPFRDDRAIDASNENLSNIKTEIGGKDVILVDDVLYTGRTARAALDAIVQYGRPASIQLLILVDRGNREYPIQPDYLGLRWPTNHRDRVIVTVDSEVSVHVLEETS